MSADVSTEKALEKVVGPNDKLVRFNNEFFKVIKGSPGNIGGDLRLQKITEEDVSEFLVLGTLEGMYAENIEKSLQLVQTELLESAKKNLKKVVIASLGFDDTWSEWKVNSSNGQTKVGALLAEKTKQFILEEQLGVNNFFTGKEKELLKTALLKEIQEQAKRAIHDNYKMNDLVSNLIQTELKAQLTGFIKENVAELMFRRLKGKEVSLADLTGLTAKEIEENPYMKK